MNQQSKKNLTNRIVALAGITVFAFFIGIYVCVFSNYLTKYNTRKKLFGATYMTMNNEFYKIVNNQIRMQVEKNGDQMITLDPALDQKKQNEQIKQLVKRKVDAIFLNPVDWKAVEPGLVAAKKAKIPVIVIDSQVYRNDLVAMTIVSDNYKAGVLCAKEMMKQKDQANIILLTHNAAKSAVDRINGFLDTIKGHDAYQVVDCKDCLGQTELSMPQVESVINSAESFDTVMALNDQVAIGALAAIENMGLTDTVKIYGVDGSPDMKTLLATTSSIQATIAQSPITIGEKAIQAGYQLDKGKKGFCCKVLNLLSNKVE